MSIDTFLVIYVMAGTSVTGVDVTQMPTLQIYEEIGAQAVQDHDTLVFECLQNA